jgi:hypothetical protein
MRSGNWSTATTWSSGKIPTSRSVAIINAKHNITIDRDVQTASLIINSTGIANFFASRNSTLTVSGNIKNLGRIIMKPLAGFTQTIKFIGIDESKFVGVGMDMVDSDPGLWVQEKGTLEIAGASKSPWLNLADSAHIGEKIIRLSAAPSGWRPGDEISIAPTLPISDPNFSQAFDVRKITRVTGKIVYLDSGIKFNHPVVLNPFNSAKYTAEVINLTRNVRIEGMPGSRGHIHLMTSLPHQISNLQIRYMGPSREGDKILGRYPLHIHMSGNSSVGSVIRGVVIRDCSGPGFVVHASHGVLVSKCTVYNLTTKAGAFWWDPAPNNGTDPINNSNFTTYDSCISALVHCEFISGCYRVPDFLLGSGIGNKVTNCIGIGNQGGPGSSTLNWPEFSNYMDNLWVSTNNLSHNNKTDGIFTWQNDPHPHIINGFIAYNNGSNGIEHGAYTNSYKYNNIYLIGNKVDLLLHANPRPKGTPDSFGYVLSFNNLKATGTLNLAPHTLVGNGPTLFKDCSFKEVVISEFTSNMAIRPPGLYDFVNCNLSFDAFKISGMQDGSIVRVQDDGGAFSFDKTGQIYITKPFFLFKP